MNLRLQKWVLGKKIYVHSTSSFAFKDCRCYLECKTKSEVKHIFLPKIPNTNYCNKL